MGQQVMGKPAKTKRSAERVETPDELDDRLRKLAGDSWAAYLRDQTKENLQRANLLSAIGYSPDLRKKLAQYERRLAGKAARTDPQHPDKFWRKVWCKLLVPVLVAHHHGEPEAVARDLIVCMPVALRLECSKYPKNETELGAAVAAVVSARNFAPELTKCREEGPWNPFLVARAVLRGLGMSNDDAKTVLRPGQWDK
jgi:hypothetical protein